MPDTPSVWEFVLIAVAGYRVWRLLAEDTILDRPRRALLNLGDWQEGDPTPEGYRGKVAEFLTCPWCMGFWIVLAWWAAWILWPEWAVALAVPWALSALVAFCNAVIGALTE